MTKPISTSHVSRRGFLKVAGGAALAVAGASVLPQFLRKTLLPEGVANAQSYPPPDLYFAGTDGWISLPASPNNIFGLFGRGADPSGQPRAGRIHHLHFRLPQRHRAR